MALAALRCGDFEPKLAEVPPYEGIKAKRRREAAEKLAIAP